MTTNEIEQLELRTLEDAIKNFDLNEYKSKMNDYSNVFYLMNLRENTHSELLTWLFDIKTLDKKETLRHEFLKAFFEYIGIDSKELETLDVKTQVEIPNGIPDIVIKTNNYILVIEVKLDAKINICKNKTQLENYWDDLSSIQEKQKKFIFIYTEDAHLDNKKYSVKIKDKDYQDITGNEIIKKLDECGKHYECIQFSDIILILYKILKESFQKKQKNSEKNEITDNLIFKLNTLLEDNTQNKRNNKIKIDNTLKNIRKNYEDKIDKNTLQNWGYRKPSCCNIKNFKDKLKGLKNENNFEDFIKKLLVQYIEYWSFCNRFTNGYSQIIEIDGDLYYIWDVCKKIKDDYAEIYNSDEYKDIIDSIIK